MQSKKGFKQTGDKYVKGGYIVKDTRFMFDFIVSLRRGDEVSVRKCYTRAETIAQAENLVKAVATELKVEGLWDSFDIKMVA